MQARQAAHLARGRNCAARPIHGRGVSYRRPQLSSHRASTNGMSREDRRDDTPAVVLGHLSGVKSAVVSCGRCRQCRSRQLALQLNMPSDHRADGHIPRQADLVGYGRKQPSIFAVSRTQIWM